MKLRVRCYQAKSISDFTYSRELRRMQLPYVECTPRVQPEIPQ